MTTKILFERQNDGTYPQVSFMDPEIVTIIRKNCDFWFAKARDRLATIDAMDIDIMILNTLQQWARNECENILRYNSPEERLAFCNRLNRIVRERIYGYARLTGIV